MQTEYFAASGSMLTGELTLTDVLFQRTYGNRLFVPGDAAAHWSSMDGSNSRPVFEGPNGRPTLPPDYLPAAASAHIRGSRAI